MSTLRPRSTTDVRQDLVNSLKGKIAQDPEAYSSDPLRLHEVARKIIQDLRGLRGHDPLPHRG